MKNIYININYFIFFILFLISCSASSPSDLVLTTKEISNMSKFKANSGATIKSSTNEIVYQKGIIWGKDANLDLLNFIGKTDEGFGLASFDSELSDLEENTAYFVRAYLVSNNGIFYGESISFTYLSPLFQGGDVFIDYRDMQEYPTVLIGNKVWFAKNLNIGNMVAYAESNNGIIEKRCYQNYSSNCDIYGGLYTWDEAMNYNNIEGSQGICPDGWYIPKKSDFEELTDFFGGTDIAGGKLKETGFEYWNEPNEGATNESGFSLYAGGYWTGATWFYLKQVAYLMSSTSHTTYGSSAYLFVAYKDAAVFLINSSPKSNGFSLRCIKNTS